MICQDLLDCDHMLVIHHTDCGGQVTADMPCSRQIHDVAQSADA